MFGWLCLSNKPDFFIGGLIRGFGKSLDEPRGRCKLQNTGLFVNLSNLPAGPVLRRVSIVSAYFGCGVLGWLSRLPAEGVGAEAARGWLVFMALPPWLLSCLIAIRSGNQLGGMWKWLAWPPLAVPTLWFIARGLIQVDWQKLING